MEVSVEAPVDRTIGMVMDFAELKAYVKPFIDLLDHSDINSVIPNPTAENVAAWLWKRLKAETELPVVEIKVFETEDSWVTLRR